MTKENSAHPQRDVLLQTLLERSVDQIFSPLEHFIRKQTTSALLLVIATVTALVLANLPIGDPISRIAAMELGFSLVIIPFTYGAHNASMLLSIGSYCYVAYRKTVFQPLSFG